MIIKPSNRIAEVKEYYFATKLAEIAEMNRQGKQIINLGIGSPDLAPPAEVIKELHRASVESDANKYQTYRGISELREAFANHYKEFLGVDLNSNAEILPLLGSKEGIMHISMSFLNPGDEVLVPNPAYPSYSICAELAGADVKYFDLKEENDWLPEIKQLEALSTRKTKMMWINYPNMPTGARINKKTLTELVSFARRHNILLCHDNPYNLILNADPMSVFIVADSKECCLELYSLSKCFNMAGWRVGAVMGHKDYIDTIMRYKSNMDSGMYKAVQKAAAIALGMGSSWFESLNREYSKRRELAQDIMALLDCKFEDEAAGLFVWARTPEYVSDVEEWVEQILQQAGVFLTPGFIFGTNGSRYVRISLCSTEEDFKKAFQKIDRHFIKSIAES